MLLFGALVTALANDYESRTHPRAATADPRPAWQRCAAGTVPVLGKTLSGTVCVPGSLVAGDEVLQ